MKCEHGNKIAAIIQMEGHHINDSIIVFGQNREENLKVLGCPICKFVNVILSPSFLYISQNGFDIHICMSCFLDVVLHDNIHIDARMNLLIHISYYAPFLRDFFHLSL